MFKKREVSVSLQSIIHSYKLKLLQKKLHQIGFRLLTEYHSFLFGTTIDGWNKFIYKFPSPYGVSFILIQKKQDFLGNFQKDVSVSLRSIIHSYTCYLATTLLSQIVSVSLRSIIHSYDLTRKSVILTTKICFRLLTEYHSFLL